MLDAELHAFAMYACVRKACLSVEVCFHACAPFGGGGWGEGGLRHFLNLPLATRHVVNI